MLSKFLNDCNCAIADEKSDYELAVRRLIGSNPLLVFMPMITYDLTMLHVMSCTDTRTLFPTKNGEVVYIAPIGAHDFYFKSVLEKAFSDFYIHDTVPEFDGFETYSLSLYESILLRHESLSTAYNVPGWTKANIIYLSLSDDSGNTIHMLFMCETPQAAWETLINGYGLEFDLIVDSNKGFGDHVQHTEIVRNLAGGKSIHSRNALICKGIYAGDLPEEYVRILCFDFNGREFSFYLPPWTDKDSNVYVNAYRKIDSEKIKAETIEQARKKVDDYIVEPTGEVPLVEIDVLIDYLSAQIKDDGGVADFSNPELMCSYSQPGSYSFIPNETLIHRADLFIYLSAKYIFSKTSLEQREAEDYLSTIIHYHCKRVEMQQMHPNAYVFSGAEKSLEHFIDAIYDRVKKLSCHEKFAEVIAFATFNRFEEALLRCAYRHKDIEYAHWIIDNQFFRSMQTELFSIICKNDIPKAKDVASRLSVGCIGWIVSDTCRKPIRSRNSDEMASAEAHIIFGSITKNTAEEVRHYLRGYDRAHLNKVHRYLMTKYFPE